MVYMWTLIESNFLITVFFFSFAKKALVIVVIGCALQSSEPKPWQKIALYKSKGEITDFPLHSLRNVLLCVLILCTLHNCSGFFAPAARNVFSLCPIKNQCPFRFKEFAADTVRSIFAHQESRLPRQRIFKGIM